MLESRTPRARAGWTLGSLIAAAALAFHASGEEQSSATTGPGGLQEVVVTAVREGLIGSAETSSQGVVVRDELELLPAFRPAQLLETVPGLVVTSHSGEGKANQYLMRGFSLDHGTDLATFVDGMPVNGRTHAHGQGYTDLNFLIPELAAGLTFTKGPYFAAQGDFSSVGSVHMDLIDQLAGELTATAGTLNYQRVFAAGSQVVADGNLLAASEIVHYDGPWTNPDDLRKVNAVVRYTHGVHDDGYSLTAMFYHGEWNATTDQPERAIEEGLIGRFGSLDPSDGGHSQRWSLSGQYGRAMSGWQLRANAYVIGNQLTLWNNFTHFLDDPVNGDQHAQQEGRTVIGGAASLATQPHLFGVNNDVSLGVDTRYDDVRVGLAHTRERVLLATVEQDEVHETSVGAYASLTTYWTDWFRSILGLRQDYFTASDQGTNAGEVHQGLLQPKASLAFTLSPKTELYASAGRGFHSDDVRGATQASAPLLAASTGAEVGARSSLAPNLNATLTLFQIDFRSELTYDADAGATVAGRPSRRRGVELNATYVPFSRVEIYASVAATHARYTDESPAGNYIPDAPEAIGSLGVYLRPLHGWSGGLQYRYFGAHPLVEDNSVRSRGDQEWNLDARYALASGWAFGFSVFNLFNQAYNAADYYYVSRLPGEPATGVAGVHIHPLEPRNARLTLTKQF
jgi:outer membrane cobalamin receptor